MIDASSAFSTAQNALPEAGRDYVGWLSPQSICWVFKEGGEQLASSGPPPWFGAQCPGARLPVYAYAYYVVEDTMGWEDAYSKPEAAVV